MRRSEVGRVYNDTTAVVAKIILKLKAQGKEAMGGMEPHFDRTEILHRAVCLMAKQMEIDVDAAIMEAKP